MTRWTRAHSGTQNRKRPPLKFNAKNSTSLGAAFGLRGRAIRVRSKFSGAEGVVFPNDPHIYIEGPNVGGWYRRSDVVKDFLLFKKPRSRKTA